MSPLAHKFWDWMHSYGNSEANGYSTNKHPKELASDPSFWIVKSVKTLWRSVQTRVYKELIELVSDLALDCYYFQLWSLFILTMRTDILENQYKTRKTLWRFGHEDVLWIYDAVLS